MSDIIWHYTSMEAMLQIVRNRSLFFSSAAYLNDSREIAWVEHILKNRLSVDDGLDTNKMKHLSGCALSTEVAIRASPFIASFSMQPDQLSQWRAYADDGKGIAIGFRKDWLLENLDELYTNKGLTILRQRVEYLAVDALPTVIYEAFQRICAENREYYRYECDDWPINMDANYFLKNAAFQEEEEYRICYLSGVCAMNASNIPPEQFRTSHDGRIVPYVELSLAKQTSKLPIVGLVLGPRNVNSVDMVWRFMFSHGNMTPEIEVSKATYRR
jgi:hypothetical protein